MSEKENTGAPEERVPRRVIGTPQPGVRLADRPSGEPESPGDLPGGVREAEPGTGVVYPDPASARRVRDRLSRRA